MAWVSMGFNGFQITRFLWGICSFHLIYNWFSGTHLGKLGSHPKSTPSLTFFFVFNRSKPKRKMVPLLLKKSGGDFCSWESKGAPPQGHPFLEIMPYQWIIDHHCLALCSSVLADYTWNSSQMQSGCAKSGTHHCVARIQTFFLKQIRPFTTIGQTNGLLRRERFQHRTHLRAFLWPTNCLISSWFGLCSQQTPT